MKYAYLLWGEIPEEGLNPVSTLPRNHMAEASIDKIEYTAEVYKQGTRSLISTMLHESTHVADFQSHKYDGFSDDTREAVMEVRATARELAMASRLGLGATNSGVNYQMHTRSYQATFIETLRTSPSLYNQAMKGTL